MIGGQEVAFFTQKNSGQFSTEKIISDWVFRFFINFLPNKGISSSKCSILKENLRTFFFYRLRFRGEDNFPPLVPCNDATADALGTYTWRDVDGHDCLITGQSHYIIGTATLSAIIHEYTLPRPVRHSLRVRLHHLETTVWICKFLFNTAETVSDDRVGNLRSNKRACFLTNRLKGLRSAEHLSHGRKRFLYILVLKTPPQFSVAKMYFCSSKAGKI